MNVANTVKKRLSGAAIVSMIGAILFAIAAACMVFVPLFGKDGSGFTITGNTIDVSVLSENGRKGMDMCTKAMEQMSRYSSEAQFQIIAMFVEIITATVAFFGMILAAVMIVLGKALNFKKGGRVLALIFAILGLLVAGFYLVWTIVYCNQYKYGVGIGSILMASFAFAAFIFCCIGVGERSAFKTVGTNPYDPNSFYTPQNAPSPYNNVPPQPVQPQNMGYTDALNQSFAPSQPSVPQPAQTSYPSVQTPAPQPVQTSYPSPQPAYPPVPAAYPPVPQPVQQNAPINMPRQPEEDQPTIAQIGAIEGISGDYAGTTINLKPGDKVLIGRDASACNIILSAERKDISRRHCSVKYDPYTDSFKVIDMSSNGTYVNGQPLVREQETQLPAGTVISLGNGENQFRFKKV